MEPVFVAIHRVGSAILLAPQELIAYVKWRTMLPRLLTLNSLVISQTKSFMQDEFLIADDEGVPVGTILQSTSLKDMFFNASRSLQVAFTDEQGNPQQPLMVIKDPPNFVQDTYEVYLPGVEKPMAIVTKRFAMFKTRLSLEMEGFPEIEIEGDVWDWNITITSQGQPLAEVRNEWGGVGRFLAGKNTYRLSIAPGLDPQQHAGLIGAVMCMDMLRTKAQNSS